MQRVTKRTTPVVLGAIAVLGIGAVGGGSITFAADTPPSSSAPSSTPVRSQPTAPQTGAPSLVTIVVPPSVAPTPPVTTNPPAVEATSAPTSTVTTVAATSVPTSAPSTSATTSISSAAVASEADRTVSPLADARAAIAAKRWIDAKSILQKIVNDDPKNADGWNLLGYATRKGGDPKSAIPLYAKALALDPKHLGALEYQGEAFVQLRQFSKAKRNLARLKKVCGTCSEYRDLANALKLASR